MQFSLRKKEKIDIKIKSKTIIFVFILIFPFPNWEKVGTKKIEDRIYLHNYYNIILKKEQEFENKCRIIIYFEKYILLQHIVIWLPNYLVSQLNNLW